MNAKMSTGMFVISQTLDISTHLVEFLEEFDLLDLNTHAYLSSNAVQWCKVGMFMNFKLYHI